MPFYEQLEQLEKLIDDHLNITQLEGGLITVNDLMIDTNVQLEMLSPEFFYGTGDNNHTTKAYQELLQSKGILPKGYPKIPLFRDTVLRTKTNIVPNNTPDAEEKNQKHQAQQNEICVRFLMRQTLANQWTMLFREDYDNIREAIIIAIQDKPLESKTVTHSPDGVLLESGGYQLGLYKIGDHNLWLYRPQSSTLDDVIAAADRSLNDTNNTHLIVNSLKNKLLSLDKIAFNIRGLTKTVSDNNSDLMPSLGGGHQHFMIIDRTTRTIYAINDNKNEVEGEDYIVFKRQIELFLEGLGDKTSWNFQFIQGKSRLPENKNYLAMPCSVSQFIDYVAILAGVSYGELQDTIPPKVSTLMYLLQYASAHQNKELYAVLDRLMIKIRQKMLPADEHSIASVKVNKVASPADNKTTSSGGSPSVMPERPTLSTPQNSRHQDSSISVNTTMPKPEVTKPSVKDVIRKNLGLLLVIERLELGCKSYNPYWINSSKKLNAILQGLQKCLDEHKDIDTALVDPKSDLAKAINLRRLPYFNFFSEPAPVKSRDLLNRNISRAV